MKTNDSENRLPTLCEMPAVLHSLDLRGENGSNREKQERCQIRAGNDLEAIHCWLDEYRQSPATIRAYRKEAERLLLWSVFQCKKPLSSLDRDDFDEYLTFLDRPEPEHIWCTRSHGGGTRRGKPGWRPFVSGLGYEAKQLAISSIDSLMNYLVDARYLVFNPLSLMRKRHHSRFARSRNLLHERMLEIDEWHSMLDALDEMPEDEQTQKAEKERLRFMISILYFLGLRNEELASHSWNSFRKIDSEWWFFVTGKGDKPGIIPVCDELLRAVIHYRTFLKKPPLPSPEDAASLITTLSDSKGITSRQINKILKILSRETSKKYEGSPEKQEKLKKFSAHWLRHLSASMQDRAGIQFKHIRANHRHENDETTRRYIHSLDRERHHDMQKLSMRICIED